MAPAVGRSELSCGSAAALAPVTVECRFREALAVDLGAPLAMTVLVNVPRLVGGGRDQPLAPVGIGEERKPVAWPHFSGGLAVAVVWADREPDAVADLDRHQVAGTAGCVGDRGHTVVGTSAEAVPTFDVHAHSIHVDPSGGESDKLANIVVGVLARVANPGPTPTYASHAGIVEALPLLDPHNLANHSISGPSWSIHGPLQIALS